MAYEASVLFSWYACLSFHAVNEGNNIDQRLVCSIQSYSLCIQKQSW